MSIVKWTKKKIDSYFGLGDYKTKFLETLSVNEELKKLNSSGHKEYACGSDMDIDIDYIVANDSSTEDWFNQKILKQANVNNGLEVKKEVIEMLYKVLYGSDVKAMFNRSYVDHKNWKLIIRTNIDDVELTMCLDSEKDNSIYIRLWTLLDSNEEENICFTIEVDKMSYQEVRDKINISISTIQKRKLNYKLRESNMRERQGNTMEDTDMSVEFSTCYLDHNDVRDINRIAIDVEELLDSKLILLNDIELEEVMDNNIELFSNSCTTNIVSQMIFQLRILDVVLDYLMVRELKNQKINYAR